MRLVWVEPNPNYVNLDMWSYACDCGATAKNFVAHSIAPECPLIIVRKRSELLDDLFTM